MKVFISWSGEPSRSVAQALRKSLRMLLQSNEYFVSTHDIEGGARGLSVIASKLEETSYGILCLTADNWKAPWINFEAGALTKLEEGRACGLLLGALKATDISGPIGQFQHRDFNQEQLLVTLLEMRNLCKSSLTDVELKEELGKRWDEIEQSYHEGVALAEQPAPAGRALDEKVDEILQILRQSDSTRGIDTLSGLRSPDTPNFFSFLEVAAKLHQESERSRLVPLPTGSMMQIKEAAKRIAPYAREAMHRETTTAADQTTLANFFGNSSLRVGDFEELLEMNRSQIAERLKAIGLSSYRFEQGS